MIARLSDPITGEQMHPLGIPEEESMALYHVPLKLKERWSTFETHHPLVIWDVGLGMGCNVLTLISLYESSRKDFEILRPVKIISFDVTTSFLLSALNRRKEFPFLEDLIVDDFIGAGFASRGSLEWYYQEGDIKNKMFESPSPDIILFDPFSYRTNPSCWHFAFFQALTECTLQKDVVLSTYSASTAMRGALLSLGWSVAYGPGFGKKRESTLAGTPKAAHRLCHRPLLNQTWLARFKVSSRRFPDDVSLEESVSLTAKVLSHNQFKETLFTTSSEAGTEEGQ